LNGKAIETNASTKAWLNRPWDAVAVHYQEIALKRGNRRNFLEQLRKNVERVLRPLGGRVENHGDRLIVPLPPEQMADALQRVSQVFGVAYAAPIQYLPRDVDQMAAAATETYRAVSGNGCSFAIRARRVDKTFPHSSQEVMARVGRAVLEATGARVDLDHPNVTLRFRIYGSHACLLGPMWPGPEGLPLGVSGKVLTLFSGGIDSPVAAWLMMRRGCATDFLHFHVFSDAQRVLETKISGLVERLLAPQAATARLTLIPYHVYQLALMTASVPPDLELVLFRRFMYRVACALAQRGDYRAIATGDNLAQVASQTMENLAAVDVVASVPVFRPILAHNKPEIVRLAQRIDTYALSIASYKDCCSLVSRHPKTRPSLDAVQRAESMLPPDLVERALSEMAQVRLPRADTARDAPHTAE